MPLFGQTTGESDVLTPAEFQALLLELSLREQVPFAPGTKTKIRNIMSAIYSRGIRHEWITFNPISKVRRSAERLREPDVLTPDEFQALVLELFLREQVMVMLAGTTGLRRSEMFALRWSDVNFQGMQVVVTRSCVRNCFGKVKTDTSGKPVPLHTSLCALLMDWATQDVLQRGTEISSFLLRG